MNEHSRANELATEMLLKHAIHANAYIHIQVVYWLLLYGFLHILPWPIWVAYFLTVYVCLDVKLAQQIVECLLLLSLHIEIIVSELLAFLASIFFVYCICIRDCSRRDEHPSIQLGNCYLGGGGVTRILWRQSLQLSLLLTDCNPCSI